MRRALALAAAAVTALLLLEPMPNGAGVRLAGVPLPDLCPSAAFGAACPGCGTGRATVALLHGDLAGAWALQPATFAWAAIPVLFLLPFAPRLRARAQTLLALAGAAVASILHALN